jgi:hypothetical protein
VDRREKRERARQREHKREKKLLKERNHVAPQFNELEKKLARIATRGGKNA